MGWGNGDRGPKESSVIPGGVKLSGSKTDGYYVLLQKQRLEYHFSFYLQELSSRSCLKRRPLRLPEFRRGVCLRLNSHEGGSPGQFRFPEVDHSYP